MTRKRRHPSAPRALFDANAWNALADPSHPLTVGLVDQWFHDRTLEVVGTVEMLGEVMAAARVKPPKAELMRRLFRRICWDRVLVQTSDRFALEATIRSKLPDGQLFLPRGLTHLVTSELESNELETINNVVYEQKMRFFERDAVAMDRITERLEESGHKWSDVDPTVTTDAIREMVIDALDYGRKSGLPTAPNRFASVEALPTVWLVAAASLARLADNAQVRGKPTPSDNSDHLHIAAAGYADYLITDDKRLRRVANRIPQLPFQILTTCELIDFIGN